MARPGRPERNTAARSFRQLRRFHHVINSDKVFGTHRLLTQARIGAACNALHPIKARLCRWLLHTRDRADSDTIMLTQEFLAQMLGIRRTSVITVASEIHATGAVSYSRGVIKVIDLGALKAMSCECYETLREHTSSFAQPEAGVRSSK